MKTRHLLNILLLALYTSSCNKEDTPLIKKQKLSKYFFYQKQIESKMKILKIMKYILAKEENQVDFQEINISAIEGFHYEKGYEYELLVEKKTLVNTNFDNNQTKYKLIELISKNKVDFKYLIITKENPFILHSAGGRFEIPLQCIKEKYINNKLSEKEHHPLKGLKYKIGTNYGGITNIVKEGKEIGFYKIIIERYGAYNMNGIPEWFCAFYTKNANLNFDLKPSPIYEQIFEQPQTKGEQYLILPIINISIGTFDI